MVKTLNPPKDDLYDRDFYARTVEQAAKLRARAHDEIAWENAAEEIGSLGRSDKRETESRLKVLLGHLLNWQFQPAGRSASGRATILEQRRRISRLAAESPSLASYPEPVLPNEYAFEIAETELEETSFSARCPYRMADMLDVYWLPTSRDGASPS